MTFQLDVHWHCCTCCMDYAENVHTQRSSQILSAMLILHYIQTICCQSQGIEPVPTNPGTARPHFYEPAKRPLFGGLGANSLNETSHVSPPSRSSPQPVEEESATDSVVCGYNPGNLELGIWLLSRGIPDIVVLLCCASIITTFSCQVGKWKTWPLSSNYKVLSKKFIIVSELYVLFQLQSYHCA